LVGGLALLVSASGAVGQGTFQNLDFEQATIVSDPSSPYYPNAVYASDAIPGWTPDSFLGTNDVLYNEVTLGAAGVSILGTDGIPPALDGKFSVYLYGGAVPSPGASISQTAVVPVGAESIMFEAENAGSVAGKLVVSLGGQNIPFSALSTGSNYTLYGSNIPAFGGQSEQLTFSALAGGEYWWEIDDIQFSDSSVPEPTTLGLSALGALLLGWRVLRRRQ
jgi:hypothetical protein